MCLYKMGHWQGTMDQFPAGIPTHWGMIYGWYYPRWNFIYLYTSDRWESQERSVSFGQAPFLLDWWHKLGNVWQVADLFKRTLTKKIIFTCSWDYNQWRGWDCHFQFTNSFDQWWDPVASLPGGNCALKFSSHQTCNVAISAELYVPHVVTICFLPALCVLRQNNYSETPQKRNPLCLFEVGKTKHLLDWLATCLVEFRV